LSSATILLNYGSDDGVMDASAVRIAKSNGPDWMNIGGVGTANGTGTITSGNFYSFSDFVLANIYTVLPLKWISFTAEKRPAGNELKWQTANEMNVTRFRIERSADGNSWGQVTEINAGSNNNSYTYTDNHLAAKCFYRIKAVDADGRITISKIVFVSSERISLPISVYPNPLTGKTLNCLITDAEILKAREIEVKIFDIAGKLKYSATEEAQAILKITPKQLLPGHYLLMIKAGDILQQKNFIVE
jgi:hypothetical protein